MNYQKPTKQYTTMKRFSLSILFIAVAILGYSQINVSLPTITAVAGTNLSIPVSISGASDQGGTPISAADVRINFNSSVLTYTGISNFYSGMPASQWVYSGSNTTGLVSANWLEPNLLTLSVPDNTILYYINFTYNGGTSPLTFSFTEFTDVNYNLISTVKVDGSVSPDSKTLNLNVFLQGLFDGSASLNPSQDESGSHFGGNVAEQITVELHSSSSYSNIEYSASNVDLSTSGTASLTIPSNLNGSYFITIKSRNSIETTSATAISFAGSSIAYDFTDGIEKAFGSNMVDINGKSCVFAGDANNDGLVDSSDMISVDNLASAFGTGYIPEDINGDGLIDSTDMIAIDNNATSFISSILP